MARLSRHLWNIAERNELRQCSLHPNSKLNGFLSPYSSGTHPNSIDGLSVQVLYNARDQSPNISLSVSYIVKPVSRSYFWTMDHEVKLTPSVQSGAVRSWKSSLNREGLQRRQ